MAPSSTAGGELAGRAPRRRPLASPWPWSPSSDAVRRDGSLPALCDQRHPPERRRQAAAEPAVQHRAHPRGKKKDSQRGASVACWCRRQAGPAWPSCHVSQVEAYSALYAFPQRRRLFSKARDQPSPVRFGPLCFFFPRWAADSYRSLARFSQTVAPFKAIQIPKFLSRHNLSSGMNPILFQGSS